VPQARRSVRERRSTVVTLKLPGQAAYQIKVNNQYDLNEGERSVFDAELAGLKGPLAKATPAWVPKPHKPDGPPKPARVVSAEEQMRLAQNKEVAAIAARLDNRRSHWMRGHVHYLDGWIPARAGEELRAQPLEHLPPVERFEEQPGSVNGTMKEYQIVGTSFMARMVQEGVGCILADEMGLGKTLQTIALIAWLKLELKEPGSCLVVVPLSVLSSWMAEFKKWCPQLKVSRMHSSDQQHHKDLSHQVLSAGPDAPDVIVTTYEMVKSMGSITRNLYWRLLVLDEGHLIKNDASGRHHVLKKVRSASSVLLTGTPLQNNLKELWALLAFLNPIFSDPTPFEDAFALGTHAHSSDSAALASAHKLLSLFCLRRVKREVEVSLPPLIETRVQCPLSKLQTFWYRRLLMRDYKTLLAKVESDESGAGGGAGVEAAMEDGQAPPAERNGWRRLQALFMQLRKCCNHPYMFPDAEKHFDGSTGEDLIEVSGKLAVLDRLLKQLYEEGHRVVLFSQFTMMLDIFEDMLRLRGYQGKYLRLDGSTNRVQRTVDIAEYNRRRQHHEEMPFLFMLSTRAGGLGVNLQTADTVILYDSDWNPQVDAQAIARVHRIGQTRPVAALRLVTAGSAEQRVVERAEKKLYLDAMVGRGSTAEAEALERKEQEGVSKQDLLGALMFGADRIFTTDSGDMPTDEELAQLLASARYRVAEPKEANEGKEMEAGDASQSAIPQHSAEQAAASKPPSDNLKQVKRSASDFDAAAAFSVQSTSELRMDMLANILREHSRHMGGQLANSSNKDIARLAARDMGQHREAAVRTESGKRARQDRVMEVYDDNGKVHRVLRENMYDLQQGEPSVFARESSASASSKPERTRQTPGVDYPHSSLCHICWEGKTYWGRSAALSQMMLCAGCPVAMHRKCLEERHIPIKFDHFGNKWFCTHHECEACGIKASAAGGLLFRCECCESTMCEDHLPRQAETEEEEGWQPSGHCKRFEKLGQNHPKQAYFMTCTKECRQWKAANPKIFHVDKPRRAAAEISSVSGLLKRRPLGSVEVPASASPPEVTPPTKGTKRTLEKAGLTQKREGGLGDKKPSSEMLLDVAA